MVARGRLRVGLVVTLSPGNQPAPGHTPELAKPPEMAYNGGMTKPVPLSAEWMKPGEVALLFKCDPKSIARLAKPSGKRPALLHPERTPGGHRRYPRAEVEQLHALVNGRLP